LATKTLAPGALHHVDFAHAAGIAAVNVYGHEVCIHEVCWECEPPAPSSKPFVRADAKPDGAVDMTDSIRILDHIFLGGEPLSCEDAADANDDGRVNISDAIYILGYLFVGGAPPPPPSPISARYAQADCGFDLTPDGLGCAVFDPCRPREPIFLLDSACEGNSGHSYGCGNLGGSLYQSFTAGFSNLGAVSLQLRPGGSFPAAGAKTTVRIRAGSPSGAVLATASALVDPASFSSGAPWVWFEISPPLSVSPGAALVVEWLSPAPPGVPAGTILTWMGDPNDPCQGMAYSSCIGSPTPWPEVDLYLKTYAKASP
jgi:hypothetical protein